MHVELHLALAVVLGLGDQNELFRQTAISWPDVKVWQSQTNLQGPCLSPSSVSPSLTTRCTTDEIGLKINMV